MAGGVHGGGHAWPGGGGMRGWGAYVVGGMHGRGHAWWGGHAWLGGPGGACVAGGMHDTHAPCPRADTAATAYGQ